MIGIGAAAGLVTSALSSMIGINGQNNNSASSNITASNFSAEFDQQLQQKTTSLIQNLDKNGDGSLSADEIGMSQEQFASIDSNGDGKLDTNELNAAYIKQEMTMSAQNLIKALDTNGDGKLTASELNMTPEQFASIDTNGKGAVGMQELMAANPLNSLYAKYASTVSMVANATGATVTPNTAVNVSQGLDLTA